jgi:hypothetical protein
LHQSRDGVLNRASLPSDIIAFVVFCRLRYRLTLRDLSEIMPAVGGEVVARVGGGAAQAATWHWTLLWSELVR